MLPNRQLEVRVRANFDGEVEVLVKLGARVLPGQGLVVVEADRELEKLSARNPGRVIEVHARTGQDVQKGALLLVIQEDPSA